MRVTSFAAGALALVLAAPAAADDGVTRTRHNLSVSGPGAVRSTRETQVCAFCHVPHGGGTLGSNRPASVARYIPYGTGPFRASSDDARKGEAGEGTPSGGSRVCLSCHDGTVAIGQTMRGRIDVLGTGVGGQLKSKSAIGTDLRSSHPISVGPRPSPKLRLPPVGDAVKLDKRGRVQCTSCHDPHRNDGDPERGKFLVKPSRSSELCLTCHSPQYWGSTQSSHQQSRTVDPARGQHGGLLSVAESACESCHQMHGGATGTPLLREPGARLCLGCHSGRVAKKDVFADFSKVYSHPVITSEPSLHSPDEGPSNPTFRLPATRAEAPRHVVCADCHNAHATSPDQPVAPFAGGLLQGVWGIDRLGNRVETARYQYEICFKCHGDSLNQPQARGPMPPETLRRQVVDTNLRRKLAVDAASFHPVEGPGRGADVPSLIAPLSTSSVVFCTDCHASDSRATGQAGTRGAHGSIFRHILERNYTTTDYTVETPDAYALCYKCHDRSVLLSNRSAFNQHARHVVAGSVPCSACHDSHGVSSLQGNPVNNAHLVHFDVSIARPSSRGTMGYTSLGRRRGECSVRCHGKDHVQTPYMPTLVTPRWRELRAPVVD